MGRTSHHANGSCVLATAAREGRQAATDAQSVPIAANGRTVAEVLPDVVSPRSLLSFKLQPNRTGQRYSWEGSLGHLESQLFVQTMQTFEHGHQDHL